MRTSDDIKKRIAGLRDGMANGREFNAFAEDLGKSFAHLDTETLEFLGAQLIEQCKRGGSNHDYITRLTTLHHFVRGYINVRQPTVITIEADQPAPTSAH